jgi:hypothetical protein
MQVVSREFSTVSKIPAILEQSKLEVTMVCCTEFHSKKIQTQQTLDTVMETECSFQLLLEDDDQSTSFMDRTEMDHDLQYSLCYSQNRKVTVSVPNMFCSLVITTFCP